MFIETHKDGDITLTFLQSSLVEAFPCGRRRSEKLDNGNYIPFDPEARLNTEANNRKHSSLNGFTQTYIKKWNHNTKVLTISLGGYLFSITLPEEFIIKIEGSDQTFNAANCNDFGCSVIATLVNKIDTLIGQAELADVRDSLTDDKDDIKSAARIYANILLEKVHLFSGLQDYYTSVLHRQAEDVLDDTSLDLLKTDGDGETYEDYYFSGLSFSTVPLTTKAGGSETITRDEKITEAGQTIISLCILEKDGTTWQIHQPAYLPKIEHGTTENSIVIGDTTIKRVVDTETDEVVDSYNGDLIVEGATELIGDTVIKSDLKVDKNINVGELADYEKATDDAGGYIVAKKDITAGQNLSVGGTADITGATTIRSSLAVGTTVAPNTANPGTITAETHVETPTLHARESITTSSATITSATITTAGIDTTTIGTATIGTATIGTATITDTTTDNLTVNTKATIAEADIETADIATLTGTTATIATINSDDIQQKIGENYCDVPVMFIEKDNDDKYQLKLCRINKVNF